MPKFPARAGKVRFLALFTWISASYLQKWIPLVPDEFSRCAEHFGSSRMPGRFLDPKRRPGTREKTPPFCEVYAAFPPLGCTPGHPVLHIWVHVLWQSFSARQIRHLYFFDFFLCHSMISHPVMGKDTTTTENNSATAKDTCYRPY